MKLRAVRRSDGSIDVGGHHYRLEERDGRFEVVRADGEPVGSIRFRDDVARGFEVEAPSDGRKVVEAVARLLAAPRGVLPLQ